MSNPCPQFTYKVSDAWQAVRGSERPLCALSAAYYVWMSGGKLGGEARGMDSTTISALMMNAYYGLGVTAANWTGWNAGLNHHLIRSRNVLTEVNGLTLDPYQISAVNNMTVAGGVLAMGCGLGKTITALSAVSALTSHVASPARLWVCCPKIAMSTWEEYRPWVEQHLTKDFEIVSIDSLHKYEGLASHDNSVVIFDEVHLLGSPKARRTKSAHKIRQAFTAGICLTGTLLHGGVERCLSMLDLAIPGAAQFSTAFNCGRQFHCLYKKEIGRRIVNELGRPPAAIMPEFNRWLSQYCQSLNKTSESVITHVNLPTQRVTDVEFPYSQTLDESAVAIASDHFDATGELLSMQAVAHQLGRDGIEAKLQWFNTMSEGAVTPVVLFGMYIDTLDAVEAMLTDKGYSYVRVDGSVTGTNRSIAIRQFQDGEVQYFLAQIDAASVSMNLQRSHISVTFDTSWKASTYDQSLARTCRRGQTEECFHFNLIANAFQRMVFTRLQKAMDFDASVAEWQQTKSKLTLVGV